MSANRQGLQQLLRMHGLIDGDGSAGDDALFFKNRRLYVDASAGVHFAQGWQADNAPNGSAQAGDPITVTAGQGDGNGAGGALTATAGASPSGTGGQASLVGGASLSNGTTTGGRAQVTGGAPGATGQGGLAQLRGGPGGATSGAGGNAQLIGGAATAGDSNGGSGAVQGGQGSGTHTGGAAQVIGGGGGTGANAPGGPAVVQGGDAGNGSNGNGGRAQLLTGAKDGSGLKPLVEIDAAGDVPTTAVLAAGSIGYRISGNALTVYANVGGAIKSLSIGAVA